MGFYARHIEPRLVSCLCGMNVISEQRRNVTPLAGGRVLEVGFGSGLNLPHYDAEKIDHLWALEPSETMRSLAAKRMAAAPFPIELLDLPGEEIPLDDDSADTVVIKYTMCTIPDAASALEGIRRVLKPGGRMLFCEHGRAPDEGVARWQDRLDRMWGRLAGGCHLNRDIAGLILDAGFEIDRIETGYLRRTPRLLGFNYWGVALPL
ncbi:MAG: SAM-dependent methyltransferase [Planctomycetota bacterium]|nr:MAG: SAM-dependent methyltransferase [Planctomycetota bacterium]